MKIIIVGAGRVGRNLSQSLAEDNHEVYLIDHNEKRVAYSENKLDVKVILGNGSDPEVLRRVGVEKADMVVAVTTSDETNLVVCTLAATLGAKRRIARVRNASLSHLLHEQGYRNFNIDEIINPEFLAAQSVVRAINTPGACEVADFAEGKILLRAFDIPQESILNGIQMKDISDDDFPWPFLIIGILRNHEAIIARGETQIKEGDRIYVLLPQQSLVEFLSFVDPHIHMPKKVVIYGASITGEYVANAISSMIKNIVLIEDDPIKAEAIANRIENVVVINGSAAEADILTEAGIDGADVFLATSNNDHSNLVSSVLAKKLGAGRTMITTQQPDYLTIVDQLDIDVIINPHHLAVDQLLHLIRGQRISSVTKILEGHAEAIELVPELGSAITLAPIKDCKIPRDAIVGAVSRGDKAFLVNGDTQILSGDHVVIFAKNSALKKLQKLFVE